MPRDKLPEDFVRIRFHLITSPGFREDMQRVMNLTGATSYGELFRRALDHYHEHLLRRGERSDKKCNR